MMQFYLDEMYPASIAEAVRGAGIDMVSSHELAHEGLGDRIVLLFAAEEQRCVVTDNSGDFLDLTESFYHEQLPHAGVLLIPTRTGHDRRGPLSRASIRFAREHPGGL